MRCKPKLTVIEGGKNAENIPASNVSDNFDAAAFLVQDDTFRFVDNIPPEYYGKIINGVVYGDPTSTQVDVSVDDDIFKFTP